MKNTQEATTENGTLEINAETCTQKEEGMQRKQVTASSNNSPMHAKQVPTVRLTNSLCFNKIRRRRPSLEALALAKRPSART
eukprot:m.2037 g.2037  ORF g.2037 m.2037 type:complete len:82 (+) comp1357_c0_seq1:333-578(+)